MFCRVCDVVVILHTYSVVLMEEVSLTSQQPSANHQRGCPGSLVRSRLHRPPPPAECSKADDHLPPSRRRPLTHRFLSSSSLTSSTLLYITFPTSIPSSSLPSTSVLQLSLSHSTNAIQVARFLSPIYPFLITSVPAPLSLGACLASQLISPSREP